MILYDPGTWGVGFVLSLYGSVFPKSMVWGVSSTVIAVLFKVFIPHDLQMEGMSALWAGYTSVLGFLIVFRNGQAYSRFWEGAALVHQVRGEWFNACSSLVAFCNPGEEKHQQVVEFQHLLVRLMSMLHCAALQQIASVKDDCFEIIDPNGIDTMRLKYLSTQNVPDRTDLLLLWIQRLIVEAEATGTLKIAPPILSRVFQELSRGIVNLHNVKKIKDIPFPFPYAQMITVMMLVHFLVTPLMASQECGNWQWAALVTFSVVSSFWALLYISLEIEQPFGEDVNDLPVADMQVELNHSLSLLLHREAKTPPFFELQDLVLSVSNVDMNCFGIITNSKGVLNGSEGSGRSAKGILRRPLSAGLLKKAGRRSFADMTEPAIKLTRQNTCSGLLVDVGDDSEKDAGSEKETAAVDNVAPTGMRGRLAVDAWKATPFVSHTCFYTGRETPSPESTDMSSSAQEPPGADARGDVDAFAHDGMGGLGGPQCLAPLPGAPVPGVAERDVDDDLGPDGAPCKVSSCHNDVATPGGA